MRGFRLRFAEVDSGPHTNALETPMPVDVSSSTHTGVSGRIAQDVASMDAASPASPPPAMRRG